MSEKISYLQALAHIRNIKPVFSKRIVPIEDACGWILADPLFAKYNVPNTPYAKIEGYAVSSSSLSSASPSNPIILKKFEVVHPGTAIKSPFDSVIKKEDIVSITDTELTINKPCQKSSNIFPAGNELKKGRLILPSGALIRPFDIGAIAAYGYLKIPIKSVSVGIIQVGTGFIKPGTTPKFGQTIESNSYMTESYFKEFGVSVQKYPITENERDKIKKSIIKAVKENDIILLLGNDTEDFLTTSSSIINSLGQVIFDGLLMKPAETTLLGLNKGKLILRINEKPISVMTALRMFIRPLLEMWGFKGPKRTKLTATAGAKIETDENLDELILGSTAFIEGKPIALPETKSITTHMNEIKSNGYLHIPRGMKNIEAGNVIKAVIDSDSDELKSTILIGGTYSLGMEAFVENAAEAGLIVRFGEGDPIELLKNKYCHAICTTTIPNIDIPLESFSLCDGTYLVMRTDMYDSLCGCLRRFAGIS